MPFLYMSNCVGRSLPAWHVASLNRAICCLRCVGWRKILAYAMLRDEGHIVMRRGSGAMVAPRDVGSLSQQHDREMRRMRDDIYRIAVEYKAHGGSLDEFMADVKHNASAVFQDETIDRSGDHADNQEAEEGLQ